ncbi:MAG TPA: MarR family transcriptional regulator [Steroidobacteraceae bacterium]|jgi:DNA-binding MarR family transcriptional regulator
MPQHPGKNYKADIPSSSCTCGSLRRASRRVSQFYDMALAPTGIKSTQYSILSELDREHARRGITMRELATAMVMDRSTLGHNLRPLERDDLLALRLSAEDRRRRYVELTRKGKSTLRRARRLWRAAEGRFEDIFGKQHAADLRAVLHRIAINEEMNSLPLD